MMQFNLLPHRAQQRRRRLQYFAGVLLLSMLLGGAASGFGWRAIVVSQQAQQKRNDLLRQSIGRLEAEINDAANLKLKTDALLADIAKIEYWQHQRTRTAALMTILATQVPPAVYLQKIRQQDNKITLDGMATSNRTVTELLQGLASRTGDIASAQLLETRAENRAENGALAFSLAFSIALTLR